MAKMDLKKMEVLNMTALQKELQALKEVLEVQSLKDQMIAAILQEECEATLTEAAQALREVLFAKKPGDIEITPEQGKGFCEEEEL